jgi:alkylhydroperoxidase family enzyme
MIPPKDIIIFMGGFPVTSMRSLRALTAWALAIGWAGVAVPAVAADPPAAKARARVPLPSEDEAWKLLPEARRGPGERLPSWARAFAASLPRTTAKMLELDRLHRTRSPLDAALRGKMRWVAADANRCAYAKAYAAADLRRAGFEPAELERLAPDFAGLPGPERDALAFARAMTLAADTVTDAEVARLLVAYGEQKVMAMVALLAFANFQDRLLLALDIPVEEGGPLPPPAMEFVKGAPAPPVPPRFRPEKRPTAHVPERVDDPEWRELDFDDLQRKLEAQRTGPGRIRVPRWEEVLEVLPPDYPKPSRPSRVQWTLVGLGYQPELTAAWLSCMRTFGEEADQDRVFEEEVFWVITRSLHCFY